ncbi:MAG: autotransporter domain-containing protein, partial [Deltaproteobacteria bacterium]|nr:autotransporter domain-containing protein [Deltaproteobacteria bacterium]
MSRQRTLRSWAFLLLWLGCVVILAPRVEAQSRQGSIFNRELFNVGGVGARGGVDGTFETQGSVGCGGAWGDGLTTLLNDALNQNVPADRDLRVGQRRELWRFCDAMTDAGSGWDVDTVISRDQEAQQNAGYAPAEMFGQADIAQSIASSQVTAIAARVQKVRTAMRNEERGERYAFTPRLRNDRTRALAQFVPIPLLAPMNFAAEDARRTNQEGATIANSLDQGMNAGDNAFGIEGLGVFLTGRYIRLDADTSSRELGSKTDGGGLTLGVDYRIGSNAVLGAGFGYNHYA